MPGTPDSRWSVAQQDALSFVRSLAPGSFDLAILDPPWSSLERHRARGTTTRCTGEWFDTLEMGEIVQVIGELYDVLAENAHCYVFGSQEDIFRLASYFLLSRRLGEPRADDWTVWKALVWRYDRIGMGYHYRARHQLILFLEKGKRKIHDLGVPDVLEHGRATQRTLGGRKPYPTEKPVDLLRVLVRQSSSGGEAVVDPFCGSGSVGEAALLEGRLFAGSDTAPKAVKLARKRLGALRRKS